MSTIAFLNARLACPVAGVTPGGLLVRDGAIVASGTFEMPSDATTVDCGGRTLAPGIVDLGVFRIDRAAFRAGGIVRVALMPDGNRVLDDPGIVQRAALIGKPDLWIHPIAAATQAVLRPGGAFLVYQFSPKVKHFLTPHFDTIDHDMEWWNVPPAQLYWAWKD